MNGSSFSARHASVSALALAIGALLTASAPADEIHVYPGDLISTAINAASDGDVIIVHQGLYREDNVKMQGKAITLRSEDPTDPWVVVNTQIAPEHYGERAILCVNGEGPDTVISGLTTGLTGFHIEGASPTVRRCVFQYNGGVTFGAAMYISNGDPDISQCTFHKNEAEGVGAIALEFSNAVVADCRFISNGSDLPGSGAGAMAILGGSPTITRCRFEKNEAVNCGGAILGDGCDLTISDCSFVNNSAHDGGGIYLRQSNGAITGCRFVGNTASYAGGGLFVREDSVTVSECEFIDNTALWGGGMAVFSYATPTVHDCVFFINTATHEHVGGGGIYSDAATGGHPTIEHSQVCCNIPDEVYGPYEDGGDNVLIGITPPPSWSPDPPDPVGACCLPGGLCMVGTESHCVEAGGAYQGDDTDCETADCPEPCPGDIDNDGDVDTADLLTLLGAWGACP